MNILSAASQLWTASWFLKVPVTGVGDIIEFFWKPVPTDAADAGFERDGNHVVAVVSTFLIC